MKAKRIRKQTKKWKRRYALRLIGYQHYLSGHHEPTWLECFSKHERRAYKKGRKDAIKSVRSIDAKITKELENAVEGEGSGSGWDKNKIDIFKRTWKNLKHGV